MPKLHDRGTAQRTTMKKQVAKLYFLLVNGTFSVAYRLAASRKKILPPTEPLLLLSATTLARKIRNREVLCADVIKAYIKRIEEVNPVINAVVVKNFDEALDTAKFIDVRLSTMSEKERLKLEETEPLLGVPFTCKDCYSVKDLVMTSGSLLRKDNVCENDAACVEKMRAAGAIHLALTNVPEMAMWAESKNLVYGRTLNPHDTRRSPGGSSGGEGAIIGAGGSVVGLGSDLAGSVRIPSLMNGIFGLKPTPGVLPSDGFYPCLPEGVYAHEMGVMGPMCRYSEDLEPMLKAMGGAEVNRLFEQRVDVRKLKVFYMKGIKSHLVEPVGKDMKEALKKVIAHFTDELRLPLTLLDLNEMRLAPEIYLASIRQGQEAVMKNASEGIRHIIDDNEENSDIDMSKELMSVATGSAKHTLTSLTLIKYLDQKVDWDKDKQFIAARDRMKRELTELLGEDGILLFPGWSTPADFHNTLLLKPHNLAYTGIFNALLFPVVMCPIGKNEEGLPLGVQVVGPQFSEARLIAVAKELERAFGGWRL